MDTEELYSMDFAGGEVGSEEPGNGKDAEAQQYTCSYCYE